jgi:hypothetical protein
MGIIPARPGPAKGRCSLDTTSGILLALLRRVPRGRAELAAAGIGPERLQHAITDLASHGYAVSAGPERVELLDKEGS